MSSKIRIKLTRNLNLIKKMDDECFPGEKLDDLHEHIWFIAFVDGEPAGYAALKIWSGNVGFLSRVGVLARFRGKGLQKKLIRSRERYGKKRGVKVMVTYTWQYASYSPNSLISCGYKIYRPRNAWAGPHWLYFQRKIA